jgi:hypothetical protein
MASPEVLANEKLAAEMAAINVVTSAEIVASAANSGDLNRYQNELDNSKDRVQSVKDTLQALKAHEVTPSLAEVMDAQLERSEVEIPPVEGVDSVEGFEALGRSLMPKDYLLTRLVGCESFMEDFFKKSRQIISQMGTGFKEAYILFTQSQDSLEASVDLLENSISTSPPFEKDREKILLGNRLFNLFKVNGKVSENWVEDLSKLSRSLSGLSQNYYLNNRNSLNATLSYFGGFAGKSQAEAEERFMLLGVSIPSERFKECTYPCPQHSVAAATAKQSVELMGGAYFVDIRQNNSGRATKSIGEVEDFVTRFLDIDTTGFDNSAPMIYPKLDLEIKSLSSQQIKAVIKLLRDVLKEWRKVFDGGEKFKLGESDYSDITKGFFESDISDELKDKLLTTFSALVRKNQMELLNIRVAVNSYLVLIIAGLVELCHTSIKVNTP